MAYLADGTCFDDIVDAAKAQAWASGHDTVIDVGGQAVLFQLIAESGPYPDSAMLHQRLTRLSDGVEISETLLQFNPPSCGQFSLMQLDAAAGSQIALAIGAVWVVGWAIRMLIKTLSSGDGVSTSE